VSVQLKQQTFVCGHKRRGPRPAVGARSSEPTFHTYELSLLKSLEQKHWFYWTTVFINMCLVNQIKSVDLKLQLLLDQQILIQILFKI
jgi:hypothetical protein